MLKEGGHHWLEREDTDGVTVARFLLSRLEGEAAAREIFELLYALVDQVGRSRIVLNMGRVETLDSSAIGKLVMLLHKVQRAGGRLALCKLERPIFDLMQMTHMDEIVPIYGDEQDAVRSFT